MLTVAALLSCRPQPQRRCSRRQLTEGEAGREPTRHPPPAPYRSAAALARCVQSLSPAGHTPIQQRAPCPRDAAGVSAPRKSLTGAPPPRGSARFSLWEHAHSLCRAWQQHFEPLLSMPLMHRYQHTATLSAPALRHTTQLVRSCPGATAARGRTRRRALPIPCGGANAIRHCCPAGPTGGRVPSALNGGAVPTAGRRRGESGAGQGPHRHHRAGLLPPQLAVHIGLAPCHTASDAQVRMRPAPFTRGDDRCVHATRVPDRCSPTWGLRRPRSAIVPCTLARGPVAHRTSLRAHRRSCAWGPQSPLPRSLAGTRAHASISGVVTRGHHRQADTAPWRLPPPTPRYPPVASSGDQAQALRRP